MSKYKYFQGMHNIKRIKGNKIECFFEDEGWGKSLVPKNSLFSMPRISRDKARKMFPRAFK